jgi:hypothetical protein
LWVPQDFLGNVIIRLRHLLGTGLLLLLVQPGGR